MRNTIDDEMLESLFEEMIQNGMCKRLDDGAIVPVPVEKWPRRTIRALTRKWPGWREDEMRQDEPSAWVMTLAVILLTNGEGARLRALVAASPLLRTHLAERPALH